MTTRFELDEPSQHLAEAENLSAVIEKLDQLSDEELAKLIQLPPKVFRELLQEFGRDEMVALVVNMVATSVASTLQVGELLLAASGPIVEKAGLFLYPTIRQYLTQKNLPPKERSKLLQTVNKIWKEGSATLARDLLLHDPIYTILLLMEMQKLPDIPVALLSAIAFTISILLTVTTEIGGRELFHHLQLKQLEKQGFVLEQLYESRVMLLMDSSQAQQVLEEIQTQFGFNQIIEANYLDTYYDEKSGQNGRKYKLRHRVRSEQTSEGEAYESTSLQAVFEKLTKNKQGFFPTSKDKLRLAPTSESYQERLKSLKTKTPIRQIACRRQYMQSELGIYVSCDHFTNGGSEEKSPANPKKITLEIKAHRHTPEAVRAQQEIIYFLTSKYKGQVVETNRPKNQLVSAKIGS